MKPEAKGTQLVLIPSVPVWLERHRLTFDRKFYDGIRLFQQVWPGTLKCIMKAADSPLPDFGTVGFGSSEIPFECLTLEDGAAVLADHLRGASVVLASADAFDQLHVSQLCREVGAKCVYVIENIPETRRQIVAMETQNPLLRLRRYLYIWFGERRRLRAFELADGLQSNGMPAYREYGRFSNNLLYFDTRVRADEVIAPDELERRLAYLADGKPLRLAYSGRLIRMKGADHLVRLADRLRQAEIPFHLTIYGAGELEAELKRYLEARTLTRVVEMVGAVDFHERLVPDLKAKVDLFVALHRQSDPSCSYLETLACGVPIAGYRNKALSGLLEHAPIGWGGAVDDIEGMKDLIARVDRSREKLAEKSRAAARFAAQHSFEKTFRARTDQLAELSAPGGTGTARH